MEHKDRIQSRELSPHNVALVFAFLVYIPAFKGLLIFVTVSEAYTGYTETGVIDANDFLVIREGLLVDERSQ